MSKRIPRRSVVAAPARAARGAAAITLERLETRRLMATVTGTVFNDFDADGVIDAGEQGLSGWTVFHDPDNDGFDINAVQNLASPNVPRNITDNATVTSDRVVGGAVNASVFDVNVTLNISHTWTDDLTLTLVAPNGARVVLADSVGGSGDNFTNTIFDDEAPNPIDLGAPPFGGSFRPQSPLSVLDGIDPNGTWRLEITDNETGDIGTLNSWTLNLTTAEAFTVTDLAGNYSLGNLPVGNNIRISNVLKAGFLRTVPGDGDRLVNIGAPAQTVPDINFGNRQPPGEIRGVKWNDLNANGVKDAGEPALANVRIYLDLDQDGSWDDPAEPSRLTAADGSYAFTNLAVRNYIVGEVVPAGFTQTFPGAFGAIQGGSGGSGASGGSSAGGAGSSTAVRPEPEAKPAGTTSVSSGQPKSNDVGGGSANFVFDDQWRWSDTATDPFDRLQGDPITLTWRVVPDSTPMPTGNVDGESNAPSSLRAFLNGIYGNEATWRPLLEQAFDAWSRVTGITFVYEDADDQSEVASTPGLTGIRADIRIGGHALDGNAPADNVVAYSYFPDNGDIVLDTADSFFANNQANNSRALRNILAHELGHALGLDHVYPLNGTLLMEEQLTLTFEGPQHDDTLGVNRGYGDALEKGASNNAFTSASNLGALPAGTSSAQALLNAANQSAGGPGVGAISIDDNADVDFFRLTLAAGRRLSVNLNPVGSVYQTGPQDGPILTIDSRAQSDLSLQLLAGDGATVLATASANPAGLPESFLNHTAGAGGTYFLRVTGAADAAQLYDLSLTNNAALFGTHSINVGPQQVVQNINFGNHEETTAATVVGRRVFYNNSALDGNNPAANAADDNAIPAGKQALLAGTPSAANVTATGQGLNGIMIDFEGLPANAETNLDATDFTFRTGPGGAPAGWALAPNPTTIAIRRDAGAGGSDRVTLIWSDATAVKNAWIQVTANANPDTGLAAPDTFYLANLGGDANNDLAVSVGDVGILSTNFGLANRTPEQGDFTADGSVTVGDVGVVSTNFGKTLTAPTLAALTARGAGGDATAATRILSSVSTPTSSSNSRRLRRSRR